MKNPTKQVRPSFRNAGNLRTSTESGNPFLWPIKEIFVRHGPFVTQSFLYFCVAADWAFFDGRAASAQGRDVSRCLSRWVVLRTKILP
jgi:hypothetical protein